MPNKIIQRLKKSKTFLLSTHSNVDPDALCSELAMAAFLKWLGKKSLLVNEDKVPLRYQFLDSHRQIRVCSKDLKLNYDAVIVLDCGDLNRIGSVQKIIQGDKVIINIDHHVTNESFGHFNLVRPNVSSTCEVLYGFFKEAKFPLDRNVAMLLYVGVMTDTGSFRYNNTTQETHAMISDLLRFNLPVYELYKKLYETIPLGDMKRFLRIMGCLETLFKGKVICVELPRTVVSKFSESFDLRDTIFKFLRSIQGVELVVIFTEVGSQKTRVNFRSNSRLDVAKLAKVFEGGGHRQASGCLIEENISGAKGKIFGQIKKVI